MEQTRRIRALTYGDFERVSGMLARYIDESGNDALRGIISASTTTSGSEHAEGGAESQVVVVFFDVFKQLVVHLNREVHEWFCDLLGVTMDEYRKLPFDIDIRVLTQLKEAPEVERFFTGVSLLSSGTGVLQNLFGRLKDKFDTLIKSLSDDSEG